MTLPNFNFGKRISLILTLYFIFGVIFAFYYAFYYHWPPFAYFSPGFWVVIITWPFQSIGFIQDILIYGLAGKPEVF